MARAGKDDASNTLQPRGFEDVVGGGQVVPKQVLEGLLGRDGSQVDDPVDLLHRVDDGAEIGEIEPGELLAGTGEAELADVGEPKSLEASSQPRAKNRADQPGGAGDEHSVHVSLSLLAGTGSSSLFRMLKSGLTDQEELPLRHPAVDRHRGHS